MQLNKYALRKWKRKKTILSIVLFSTHENILTCLISKCSVCKPFGKKNFKRDESKIIINSSCFNVISFTWIVSQEKRNSFRKLYETRFYLHVIWGKKWTFCKKDVLFTLFSDRKKYFEWFYILVWLKKRIYEIEILSEKKYYEKCNSFSPLSYNSACLSIKLQQCLDVYEFFRCNGKFWKILCFL